jgi:hypothetical protein
LPCGCGLGLSDVIKDKREEREKGGRVGCPCVESRLTSESGRLAWGDRGMTRMTADSERNREVGR